MSQPPGSLRSAATLDGYYTIAYNEAVGINNEESYWFPCGGLYLTFKPGTNKLLLAPQGPTSPPTTQLWRLDPVAGAAGQYIIRAAFQQPLAPTLLAYSRSCTKNEPFLATGPSAAVGVRWTMATNLQLFATVDRSCGTRFQLARFGQGTNASCAVRATAPRQRSLKLVRSVAEPQGGWITWRLHPFVAYPKTLQGDITLANDWESLRGHNLLSGFGYQLALDGDTIAVGQAEGAYMFTKNRGGFWTRRTLPPPPRAKGDTYDTSWHLYPYTVAVSADLAAVGVPWFYRKTGSKLKRPGQVLLYQLANLDAAAVTVPRPAGATTTFGQAVQVSDAFVATSDGAKIFLFALTPNGKRLAGTAPAALAVGAGPFALWGSSLACISGNDTLVYEYNKSAKKWVQRAKLGLPVADRRALALHGDTLAVSLSVFPQTSPDQPIFDDTYVLINIYKRGAAGKWALAQTIKEVVASDGLDSSRLYSGPALDADTLVIGCTTSTMMERRTDYFGDHKIFVYTKSGGGGAWARAAVIHRKDDFSSVGVNAKAVSGDIIASGSTADSQGGEFDGLEGEVLLWSRRTELAAAAGGA